jgi:hypothetical protein
VCSSIGRFQGFFASCRNGGGIYGNLNDDERLVVENSTISNNSASVGGGILIQCASGSEACIATSVNSTISSNTANYMDFAPLYSPNVLVQGEYRKA